MNPLLRVLNISQKEAPRVLLAWSLVFLIRVGFIVGWTILIASFLTKIGITLLPLLFLGNALFVMTGTLIYRHLIHKINRELLITLTAITGAALLITSAAVMQSATFVYFVLFLMAQGIFIGQLSILINLFNEDLFTPLESQRVLPIIESGETIGGIVAGLLLSSLSHAIPPYKFILLGVLLLFIVLPIILRFNPHTMELPKTEETEPKKTRSIREQFKSLKKIPFIKGLMLVVMLQWGMMNVVEYQSMKAVQQNVYHQEEETLAQETDPSVVLAEVDQHEEDLTGKLGMLHLIFYSCALLMQLIFASRIMTTLGIVPSMMVHPLVTFLNVVGMSLRFNIVTASLTRGAYEMTSVLFTNSSESTYYAIEHETEVEAKEFILGIMRPLGAIIGTSFTLGVALVLSSLKQTLALNAAVLLGSVLMLITLKTLSKKYSEMCEQNLSHKKDLPTRINAVEILGQRGHERDFPSLQKLLKRPQEPVVLKESILKTLGLREDLKAMGSILEALDEKDERIRHAAIQALRNFKDLKAHLMGQAFSRHRIVESLKNSLLNEKNDSIREEALHCFYEIAPEELTAFILHTIEEAPTKKASFIQMLRLFPDPNLGYYLEGFLDDSNPEVRAAAVIALWQFEEMRGTLEHHLNQLIRSPKKEVLLAGLHAVGLTRWENAKAEVLKLSISEDESIRNTALLTLAQLQESSVVPTLVEQLSDPLHEWFDRSGMILASFPKKFQEEVRYFLNIRFTEAIHKLFAAHHKLALESWEKKSLEELKNLYSKLSAHEEAHHVQKLLDSSD